MTNIQMLVSILLFTLYSVQPVRGIFTQIANPETLKAHIDVDIRAVPEGGAVDLKLEILNSGRSTLLVGRDPSLIENWPFRVEVNVKDSGGRDIRTYKGGFVDPAQLADLATEDGVLKWWVPLEPNSFMGKYIKVFLTGLKPGRYQIQLKYFSARANSPAESRPPQSAIASKYSIFDGTLESNSIWIEIRPKN